MTTLFKVTAFVTRPSPRGIELLLFEHPHAGIQIPAGTVEEGEDLAAAALREVAEEAGIAGLNVHCHLGQSVDQLPDGERLIARQTRVYARPDTGSFDWAYLRRGIQVSVLRQAEGFAQILYEEMDQVPNPNYVTMSILGWAPQAVLAGARERHFFHLEYAGQSPERWPVRADNHTFTLFWSPLDHLPGIISPQDEWLAFLRGEFPQVHGAIHTGT